MRQTASRWWTLALAVILLGLPCSAEVWYQNDGFESEDPAMYQMGFVSGEVLASVFEIPAEDLPVRLTRVWVLVGDGAAGGTTGQFDFSIWSDTGVLAPGTVLKNQTMELLAGDAWTEINLWNDNIVITQDWARVGFEFNSAPPPSFYRDFDGTIETHRNLIYAIPGGWSWSENLGLQGDWILRLAGEPNYGTGSPTPTPTNPGPTPTPTATATGGGPTPTPTGTAGPSSIIWDQAEYYGLDAVGRLTVTDPDLDANPGAQEQVQVQVWSDSDSYPGGIEVTLYEEGNSSDRFVSVYPHVGFTDGASSDPDDRIQVSDGDTIYARYLDQSPSGERLASADWRAQGGVQLSLLMPATSFGTGSTCWLDLDFDNPGETQDLDLYILMEVYGQYFCYPSWQDLDEAGLDHDDMFVPGGYQDTIHVIPEFAMPAVTPAGPFAFYAVMFDDGMLSEATMASNVSVWTFSLE